MQDWPKENLDRAIAAGNRMNAQEVTDAVLFMPTRPRGVTIRNIVILPAGFDV